MLYTLFLYFIHDTFLKVRNLPNLDYSLLNSPSDINKLVDYIGDSQYVLLGEASHGTSEFYKWRSEISKRLIREKEFSFIAVEGDWPDCFRVNKYIKCSESHGNAFDVLHSFNRWPTWMWANREMVELVEWLKSFNDHNNAKDYNSESEGVGFYGLDVYSLWESMEEIIRYLKRVDPSALNTAMTAYNCFDPYNREVDAYARTAAFVPENCEKEVIHVLTALRSKQDFYTKKNYGRNEDYFQAEQNAITAKEAEKYYRTMLKGDVNSWNLRDTHMMNTLERLIDFHRKANKKKQPKAIVWAHNTHIGDARFTDMSNSGMINLGQLVREKKGDHNTILVGFSTYSGTVIAADRWGAKMQTMNVPPAKEGSWDKLLHDIDNDNKSQKGSSSDKLLLFKKIEDRKNISTKSYKNIEFSFDIEKYNTRKEQKEKETEIMTQRAIGVVYNPKYDSYRNYVPTKLQSRYDSLVFIDKTTAITPLHVHYERNKDVPDTYPTGQ
jgi:erythromycin esterase